MKTAYLWLMSMTGIGLMLLLFAFGTLKQSKVTTAITSHPSDPESKKPNTTEAEREFPAYLEEDRLKQLIGLSVREAIEPLKLKDASVRIRGSVYVDDPDVALQFDIDENKCIRLYVPEQPWRRKKSIGTESQERIDLMLKSEIKGIQYHWRNIVNQVGDIPPRYKWNFREHY